ncbi:hypothetical protein Glove_450g29 [Diversispora epigaea]|uniref:Protein kinase domain-containing protein n=1 Tax=Diversispora epigaea TaxID=1348612 RepID=A0A397GS88_9GLOM|nr:hypothetical protein Glove_450g29 [Diversispora epigaea]
MDDFPSLFGSNRLSKNKLEDFNENLEKLRSLDRKAKDVQEENLKLKSKVKPWVARKGQIKLAQSNIDNSYPSEVPPKGKEDDKTYQERYAIAQKFISDWRTCIDEFKDYQKKCDELGKLFGETAQKNKDNINKTLSQLSKLGSSGRSFHFRISRPFKSQGCCFSSKIRMARAPSYSKQAQQCSICNKPYVFLKWCKFCDIEQFKKQFINWGSGIPEFDKIIVILSFLSNIQMDPLFVGRGAYANVYKANWVEGLDTWNYALGKRVQYPNTPVALKELKNSINLGKEFLEDVTAYIKPSSITVLQCHADLHIRGLVHRDLHPGNLLHYRRSISMSDLAPEVLNGEPYTQVSDVYSIGIIMWVITSGEYPFRDDKCYLAREILFWLNEFNKSPLPDTIQQFITNKSKSFDEAHDSNVEYASQSIKTQTIRDPNLEKLAAKIKKKADEWNTIHVNDYQNW